VKRIACIPSLVSLLVAMAACGGKPGAELFGYRDADEDGTGGGSAQGGAGGKQSSASTSDAVSSSAVTGPSSSVAQSSAESSASSTGSGPSGAVVYCKNAPCDAGQVCCFHVSDPQLDTCGAPGSCGADYITLACNGPEDCPSGQCCGDWNGQSYQGIACVASCPDSDVLMCEGNGGVCPPGETCFPSQVLGTGYSYCEN
jgi:hypothetical protein